MAAENTVENTAGKQKMTRMEKSWILYDVGNSAFTLLASAVLPIYFNYLAGEGGVGETDATAYWGYAASIVTLIVAVLGPTLGTLADFRGFKRPLFLFAAAIGIAGCAALGVPLPWIAFLVVFVLVKAAYSTSLVFYDSMLCDVTTRDRLDKISAQGYAWGYIGSCIPFIISIVLIVFTPLDYTVSMPLAFAVNALWWFVCTLPLLKNYSQKYYVERRPHAVRENFKRLFSVFSKKTRLPNRKGIVLFLVAVFFYIDGVYTIIDMATSFGTALGFDTANLLIALLVTQVVAFPAAIAFGKIASRVRDDVLILVCIAAYAGIALFAVFMTQVWQFWILAVAVGIFQGGIQALSRSYFAKIIPGEQSGCLFGILDIFGKGAAFMGTLLVGVVTQATGSVNLGVVPIVCLFCAGLGMFLVSMRVNRRHAAAAEPPAGSERSAAPVPAPSAEWQKGNTPSADGNA